METAGFIFLLVVSVVVLACVWGLVCNERTHKKRIALIERRPDGKVFWLYSAEFNAVSYEEHMWRLFFLRDPRPLYGPLTQGIWTASTSPATAPAEGETQ